MRRTLFIHDLSIETEDFRRNGAVVLQNIDDHSRIYSYFNGDWKHIDNDGKLLHKGTGEGFFYRSHSLDQYIANLENLAGILKGPDTPIS